MYLASRTRFDRAEVVLQSQGLGSMIYHTTTRTAAGSSCVLENVDGTPGT